MQQQTNAGTEQHTSHLETLKVPVEGMHCASCASLITRQLDKLPGVKKSTVGYAQEEAKITFDPAQVTPETMSHAVADLGYILVLPNKNTQDKSKHGGFHDHGHDHGVGEGGEQSKKQALERQRKLVWQLAPMTAVIFFIMSWELLARFSALPELPIPMEYLSALSFFFATITLFLAGKPYLTALGRLWTHRVANMDTLIGLGTITAYVYSTILLVLPQVAMALNLPEYLYFDVTIVVIGFVTLGKYLELNARYATGAAIRSLMALQPSVALRLLPDGSTEEVAVETLVANDKVIIKPGARVPVDGVIESGTSSIDESMLTGESAPVEKIPGAMVRAGTVNQAGAVVVVVTATGEGTVLSRIIAQVKEAQSSRAPIEQIADKVSSVFVPTVLVIAVGAFLVWVTAGQWWLDLSASAAFGLGLKSFVGVLVVACPCALGLATPTAIVVGVGKAAKQGILVKNAEYLEKLATITTVVLDKTGTLTKGEPTLDELFLVASNELRLVWKQESAAGAPVRDTQLDSKTEKAVSSLWQAIAALEQQSEHPIGQALFSQAKQLVQRVPEVTEFTVTPGRGVAGVVSGKQYWIGTSAWLISLGFAEIDKIQEKLSTDGGSVVMIYEKTAGLVACAILKDTVRDGAATAVAKMQQLGLTTIMLTGDSRSAAVPVATQLNLSAYHAGLLPEDKLNTIRLLQKEGKKVVMTGDGINDAPALAAADVGVAMGTGTDVAMETAGITLVGGSIEALPKAVIAARQTMGVVRQNLVWAFLYNILAIPVAAGVLYPVFGITLNPAIAGAAMALSSVSVVLNSLRLQYKK